MVRIRQRWWRHQMEPFSALLALWAGNSPVTGEFPAQRPVMRSFDVLFALCLNKRFSKQWRRRWFEMSSWSLWRHCNERWITVIAVYHWLSLNLRTCFPFATGRCGCNFRSVSTFTYWYLEHLAPQNHTGELKTLVQLMTWCRQAKSHYLSQWWPRSMSPYELSLDLDICVGPISHQTIA